MVGEDNCPFCKRIEHFQYDTHYRGVFDVVSFMPLNPVTEGHRLFVPVDHMRPTDNNQLEQATETIAAVAWWRINNGLTQDFNLILNGGALASQTIEHTHLHYVPRRPGDGLILPWTNQKVNND